MLFTQESPNGKIVRVHCSDPILGGITASAAKASALRWWLVECRTVTEGRAIIAYERDREHAAERLGLPTDPVFTQHSNGRIVLSGRNGGGQ